MHSSIIPERTGVLESPLPNPVSPIIDIHMHVCAPPQDDDYVRAARMYGVERAVGLMHSVEPEELSDAYAGFFMPCAWAWRKSLGGIGWPQRELERLEDWHSRGVRFLKYKITPNRGRPEFFLDDERLEPVFARAAELGFVVMAHIAEPSRWWPEVFDPVECGSKESYFPQVENILRRHPDLKYVGAHFGGNPEDLDYIEMMFEKFPNYHVDTSATKWVVRELSRQSGRARELFLRYSDRILFGSDLVVMFGDSFDYYTSRLYVQRRMLEGVESEPSMIFDPDCVEPDFCDGPEIRPLALPDDVLRKVYRENAMRLVGE